MGNLCPREESTEDEEELSADLEQGADQFVNPVTNSAHAIELAGVMQSDTIFEDLRSFKSLEIAQSDNTSPADQSKKKLKEDVEAEFTVTEVEFTRRCQSMIDANPTNESARNRQREKKTVETICWLIGVGFSVGYSQRRIYPPRSTVTVDNM